MYAVTHDKDLRLRLWSTAAPAWLGCSSRQLHIAAVSGAEVRGRHRALAESPRAPARKRSCEFRLETHRLPPQYVNQPSCSVSGVQPGTQRLDRQAARPSVVIFEIACACRAAPTAGGRLGALGRSRDSLRSPLTPGALRLVERVSRREPAGLRKTKPIVTLRT
jgi:hypothetical protein